MRASGLLHQQHWDAARAVIDLYADRSTTPPMAAVGPGDSSGESDVNVGASAADDNNPTDCPLAVGRVDSDFDRDFDCERGGGGGGGGGGGDSTAAVPASVDDGVADAPDFGRRGSPAGERDASSASDLVVASGAAPGGYAHCPRSFHAAGAPRAMWGWCLVSKMYC